MKSDIMIPYITQFGRIFVPSKIGCLQQQQVRGTTRCVNSDRVDRIAKFALFHFSPLSRAAI